MSTLRERWRGLPRPVRLTARVLGWVVGLRILLALLLPLVVSLVARSYGFTLDWERLALTLRSGQLELRGLELRPRVEDGPPAAPWLTLERLHADLALRDLFGGGLRLQRLELDGLDVLAERRADGSIPWLEHLLPQEPAPAKPEPAGPIDLRAPLRIDHLRASHLALHLADAKAGCDVRLLAGLRGENLGYADREGALNCQMTSEGLVDHLEFELRERSGTREAQAELALVLQGFAPGPLAGYLAPLGLAPDAEAVDGRANLVLELHPGSAPDDSLFGRIEVRELSFKRNGEEALGLDELSLYAGTLAPGVVRGLELESHGLRVHARRNAAGELCCGGLRLVPAPPAPAPAPAATAGPAARWSLAGATLVDAVFALRDESFVEPRTLRFELGSLRAGEFDPELATQASSLVIEGSAPGNAGKLSLSAALRREGKQNTLELALGGEGITLAGLRPYLLGLGLEPVEAQNELQLSGTVQAAAADDGIWTGSASFERASFAGCGLGSLALRGLRFDPRVPALSIESIDVAGLQGRLGRAQDGRVFALPLIQSQAEPPARHAPPAAAPAAAAAGPALAFELGRLRVHDNRIAWEDATQAPARAGSVEDFGLELESLHVGGAPASQPSKLHAWLKAPALLGTFELAGELRSDAQGLGLELAFELEDLQRALPESFLAPLGIELEWQHPHLAGRLDARAAGGQLAAHLRELVFEDEQRAGASVKELGIEGLRLDSIPAELGRLRVAGARIELARDEQGAFRALGLRILPRPAQAPSAEVRFPALPALGWSGIEVEDARVHWSDLAQGRKVDCTLVSRLRCGPLAIGRPMEYDLALHADELFESVALSGRATLGPDRIALEGALEARGFQPTLAGYLPPGTELRSGADALACKFHARAEPRGERALSLKAEIEGLRWGDEQVPERLGFERATLDVPVFSAEEVVLGELSLRGLRCSAARTAEPSLVLGPLRLFEAPPRPAPPAPAEAQAAAEPPPLPRIRLDKLGIELAHLEYLDQTQGPAAVPLVAAFAFAIEKPLVLADPAPETLPPLEFVLRGSAAPLAAQVELRATLKQWLVQPEFDLQFLAAGLHGAALTEVFPGLAARLDGSGLEGGEFEADLHGELSFARRGLGRFDLARPFAARFTLGPLVLRAGPGGEPLAGLERLDAQVQRVDPRTGSVQLKSLEFTKPFLRVERSAEGLRCCGLLLKPGPEAAADDAQRGPRTKGEDALARPLSDIGCARLSASGLDVLVTDTTVDPPVRLPLTDLDLELRNLTTRALREPLALPFSGSLRAGEVSLPPHGSVREVTQRALFGSCEWSGRVQLYPEPAGWFRLGLDELQLVNFRALAAAQGVELADGRLDLALRGRLSGARGLSLESVTVLSEIEMSEGEDGPIRSALGLPSPVQAVLALVRDLEGNVRLPARVHVESGALSKSEIVQAALESVSAIVMRAVLSSPFRVVGGLAGRVGAGGPPARAGAEEQVFAFDDASTLQDGLTESECLQLSGKLSADDRVHLVLEHAFGAGDLERARVLANPDPAECRELSQRLRQKKAELSRARAEAAALVRVDLAVGQTAEARAGRERLRAIDAELGRSEDALDRVHELLRSGADRQAQARLRGAARSLASQRLLRIQAQLLAVGIDPARIELKPPRIEAGSAEHGSVRLRLVRKD